MSRYIRRAVVRTTLVFDQVVHDQDSVDQARKFAADHLEAIYNSPCTIGDRQKVKTSIVHEDVEIDT